VFPLLVVAVLRSSALVLNTVPGTECAAGVIMFVEGFIHTVIFGRVVFVLAVHL
jgi:hypothetical protein